jgi:hypothetical protein
LLAISDLLNSSRDQEEQQEDHTAKARAFFSAGPAKPSVVAKQSLQVAKRGAAVDPKAIWADDEVGYAPFNLNSKVRCLVPYSLQRQ